MESRDPWPTLKQFVDVLSLLGMHPAAELGLNFAAHIFHSLLRFDALALGATAGKAYLTFRIDGQPKEMFYLRQAASDVGLSSGS